MTSRYDLTEFEWRVIDSLLPNKPRGVTRVGDREVSNAICWVLRSVSCGKTCVRYLGQFGFCARFCVNPLTQNHPLCQNWRISFKLCISRAWTFLISARTSLILFNCRRTLRQSKYQGEDDNPERDERPRGAKFETAMRPACRGNRRRPRRARAGHDEGHLE